MRKHHITTSQLDITVTIVTLDSNKGLSYLVLVFVYKHYTVMPITRYLNINLICIILLKFSTVNNVLDEYGSSIYCTTS